MLKKGSANMWWIIIGAVIALVVMIILMVMFTGKTQPLEAGLSSCESKGGVCTPINGNNKDICPTNTFAASAFDCKVGKTCCIGSPKECVDSTSCGEGKGCDLYGNKKYCYPSKQQ
jgi:hypothetical protein